MLTHEREFVNYESDKYQVYHVTSNDYYCDLHIIASTPDQEDKLLIPVHKKFIIKHLAYFKNMFNSNSNWEETKSYNRDTCSSKNGSNLAQVINIEVPSPIHLASYIKSMYTGKLNITSSNCADYHYIADYFQDEVLLPEIIEFVKKHITFFNSLELIDYSERFEKEIEEFYNENSLTRLYCLMDDHECNRFLEKLGLMKTGSFIRLVSIFKNVRNFSSENYIKIIIHWIENTEDPFRTILDRKILYEIDFTECSLKYRYKLVNYLVEKTEKNDFLGPDQAGLLMEMHTYIINISSSYIDKLEEMVKIASCNDENIKIELCEEFSENTVFKPSLKITYDIDNEKGPTCINSLIILPVQGVKSFTVINISGNSSLEAGYTCHQKVSPDWYHVGDEKWDKVITCNSDQGYFYGHRGNPHDFALSEWSDKDDCLNVCVMRGQIKFETVTSDDRKTKRNLYESVCRSEFDLSGDLFPCFGVDPTGFTEIFLLTNIVFE